MDIITLKNGSFKVLFEPKDFQHLVGQYMGADAEEYFRNLVLDLKLDSEIQVVNEKTLFDFIGKEE